MKLGLPSRAPSEKGLMRANILLIDYEHRSVESRPAGAGRDRSTPLRSRATCRRRSEICAHFEPRLVIITAELPGVSVEDAITQLRARAGLRATPFLINDGRLSGAASEADAARLGAQDILAKPYGAAALVEKVERLVRLEAGAAATQAIPQETLEPSGAAAGSR